MYVCQTCEPVDNYDFLLKCIIVGESAVGKTSILHRMTNQGFIIQQSPTIGIDFGTIHSKVTSCNEEKVIKVQIWDCAGQVRFRSIVQSYFRQAQVVFFVYDTNNPSSFFNLSSWINTFNQQIGRENYIGCVIGNKCDLDGKTDVSQVEQFCQVNGMNCYFMSAKDDTHKKIMLPMEECVLEAFNRHRKDQMKLDKPYWHAETVDLRNKKNKSINADDDEGTNKCLVCPIQ